MTSGSMAFWLLCIDVPVTVANWSFIGIPKLNYVILFLVTVTGPSCPNYRPGKWWTFVHANEIFQFPWLVLAIPCRQRRRTEYISTNASLHQCALRLKQEHLICYSDSWKPRVSDCKDRKHTTVALQYRDMSLASIYISKQCASKTHSIWLVFSSMMTCQLGGKETRFGFWDSWALILFIPRTC